MATYYPSPDFSAASISVTGTGHVGGDFDVNTNKFTVAASTGNMVVAGTSALTGDVSIGASKVTVTAASGNTAIAGTLGVTGVFSPTAMSYPVGGVLSPAQITADKNDYAPGIAGKLVLQIYADAARNITGLAAPTSNMFLWVMNIGGVNAITLKYNSASSAVGNKILCPGGVDYVLGAYQSALLLYDVNQTFWFVIGK